MNDQIRISAKVLGQLALDDFCPRCFWIKLMLDQKLPFQIFPGIFQSIDGYTKRVVHGWFDQRKEAPPWLAALGDLVGYEKPPHHSRFYFVDKKTNVRLGGEADGVLARRDNSRVIVDYKTARYTQAQDGLLPMYEVQLNAYALIGRKTKLVPNVNGLALIYFEPATDDREAKTKANQTDRGFRMPFNARVHPVDLDLARISRLLRQVREFYETDEIPDGRDACTQCGPLENLLEILGYEV